MGPADYKMMRALTGTFPEYVDLINSPIERKLHLGSGIEVDPKWVNIDQSYKKPLPLKGEQRQLNVLNMKEHYAPGSADLVLSHHLVEHLEYRAALAAIIQWAGLLASGGAMYVCVPEVAWAIDCARGGEHWAQQPEHRRGKFDTKIVSWLRVNGLAYQGGDHRSTWCAEALEDALKGAGLKTQMWERMELIDSTQWLPCCEIVAVGIKP